MMADYHIHTRLCRHAEGEPREYVERAISLGMTEMGFADHLPFLNGWAPGYGTPDDDWAMGVDELDDTERVLSDYPFEYVIGSVHLVGDGFALDHPDVGDRLPRYCTDRVFLESLELVATAARTGLFTVMGHLDQAKKFGYRPQDEAGVAVAASGALRAIAASGVAPELDTAGWRKPAGEAYPAPAILRQAARLGIPATFGSDAHRPADVGYEFPRAAAEARAAGYSSRRLDGPPKDLS